MQCLHRDLTGIGNNFVVRGDVRVVPECNFWLPRPHRVVQRGGGVQCDDEVHRGCVRACELGPILASQIACGYGGGLQCQQGPTVRTVANHEWDTT